MVMSDGMHHVISKELGPGGGKAWCGRTVWNHDKPMSIQHARTCIEKEARIQPCKKCMAAYTRHIEELLCQLIDMVLTDHQIIV